MRELSGGWEWATVEEVAADRGVTDGPFGSNLKTEHYTDSGPRVVRLQNIGNGVFRDERAHISAEHFDQLMKHSVQPGDVLVASLGELLPRACVAPESLGPAIVKADCIRVRSGAAIVPSLLMWVLNAPQTRESVGDSIKGVGRPRINLRDLRALELPIPPLGEQERIVAAIEEAFSKLDAGEAGLRTVRQLIKRMRDAILAAAVTGRLVPQDPTDTPATKLLADLGVEAQVADHLDLPPTWAAARIEEVLEHTIGGVWGADPGLNEIDVTVLRVTEMRPDGSLDPSSAARRSIKRSQLLSRSLKVGDVLLEKSGGGPKRPVGRVGMVRRIDRPSVCANFMQLMRPDRRVCEPAYLEMVLRRFHSSGATEALQTATTNIRNLKMKDYFASQVAVPPFGEQQRIVTAVERQFSFLDACERAVETGLARSAALRRSVLKAAFEGKLVPQDPSDEPASVLLDRIRAERAAAPKAARRSRATA